MVPVVERPACYHRVAKEDAMPQSARSSTGTELTAGSEPSLEQVLEVIRRLDADAQRRLRPFGTKSRRDAGAPSARPCWLAAWNRIRPHKVKESLALFLKSLNQAASGQPW
jgi:hypothetical protein